MPAGPRPNRVWMWAPFTFREPSKHLLMTTGLEYATICLITNYAAGLQKEITHQEVIDLFEMKIKVLISIIKDVIRLL